MRATAKLIRNAGKTPTILPENGRFLCHAARVSAHGATGLPLRRVVADAAGRTMPMIAIRYLAVAALAVIVAGLHIRHRPASFCLLRTLTGIPCPMCGGTTAAVDLGHGDLRAALGASPFAVGLLTLGPLLSALQPPAWWHVPRTRRILIGLVLVLSELWELHRFAVISL